MIMNILAYYLLRIVTLPFMFLPFRAIHKIGKVIGYIAYFVLSEYRKRTFSNLALANDLKLSNKQIKKIAIESFQNLAINILEYPRLHMKKDLSKIIKCENPEVAAKIYKEKKGIIFFCGHQSNWEVLFLDGTSRMQGIAIGRPIKNQKLYKWIVRIREKMGGRIITPRNALREGLRNLKKGVFLGIVGDQGMPDSNYFFPFFGRRAWSSTAPALLSYKTNCPIIVATTRRVNGGYRIHYSDPIWPNQKIPLEKEVRTLMNSSLSLLQKSIKQRPHEWLWQHNRWKQQTPHIIYKRFRHDCICIILPKEKKEFENFYHQLPVLKSIYHRDFIFILCPKKYKNYDLIDSDGVIYYKSYKDTLLKDYRFKLVYNFTPFKKIKSHFLKFSAFEVVTLEILKKLASKKLENNQLSDLSKVFVAAICRK
ncbi:MAG: Lipid A biosynthesis lauroyltransferase [Candidatus Anoxychlamydiales bacterium]|nr:Lipid A biosynthesis lauroyltransferase [Candidatus Anoxychlamydiales bacterium]NGX36074.1 Lipid A biosynthesis lauroyltransferase [Candidatus Anoxychlamydiales bacterium]